MCDLFIKVGLYCSGVCPPSLRGSIRNDNVGAILSAWLNVEDEQVAITAELANFNTSGHPDGWTGQL
jgi:hypothetical protein